MAPTSALAPSVVFVPAGNFSFVTGMSAGSTCTSLYVAIISFATKLCLMMVTYVASLFAAPMMIDRNWEHLLVGDCNLVQIVVTISFTDLSF